MASFQALKAQFQALKASVIKLLSMQMKLYNILNIHINVQGINSLTPCQAPNGLYPGTRPIAVF